MLLQSVFNGILDISAPENLGDAHVIEYRRSVRNGDFAEVPDFYIRFPNIKNAIDLGYLIIVNKDGCCASTGSAITLTGVLLPSETILVPSSTVKKTVVSLIINNNTEAPVDVSIYVKDGVSAIIVWAGTLDVGDTYVFGDDDIDSGDEIVLDAASRSLAATATDVLGYVVTYKEVVE